MSCLYCKEKTGFLKKVCAACAKLVKVINELPETFGYRELLERLTATGVDGPKIITFLDSDPEGKGTINDHITARMTNEVMAGLGQPSYMNADDVKKVRDDIANGRAPSITDHEVESVKP